jgi:hypothetical protein
MANVSDFHDGQWITDGKENAKYNTLYNTGIIRVTASYN